MRNVRKCEKKICYRKTGSDVKLLRNESMTTQMLKIYTLGIHSFLFDNVMLKKFRVRERKRKRDCEREREREIPYQHIIAVVFLRVLSTYKFVS